MALWPSETFESFRVTVNDSPAVEIAGRRSKPAGRPPLLMLHGFPQTSSIFASQGVAQALAAEFDVVCPDLRGYGQSSKPAAQDPANHRLYAKKTLARDVFEVMAHFGHTRFFLVGHDRGARVAHQLLVDYPDAAIRAIILDVVPTVAMFARADQVFMKAYWHWAFLLQPAPFPETAILGAPRTFASQTLHGLPKASGQSIYHPAAYAEYEAQFSDPATVHAFCEDYRAGALEDVHDQNADAAAGRKIKTPLRVIWGKVGLTGKLFDPVEEWEKVCRPGTVDRAGSHASDSGHYIPEEVAEHLIEQVRDFFGSGNAQRL